MRPVVRTIAVIGLALAALAAYEQYGPAAERGLRLLAQTPEQPASPPNEAARAAPGAGTPATVIDNQVVIAILGKGVRGSGGEDMGRVVDVLVDRAGQVRAAVIDFGGFLGVG